MDDTKDSDDLQTDAPPNTKQDTSSDDGARTDDDSARDGLWGVSEAFRKAVSSGFRARGVIADAVPKELMQYMMTQTDAAKDEVVRIIGQQSRRFLENIDVAGELQKILTSVSFEIKTEVRFIPNDASVRPKASVKVSARASDTEEAPEQGRASLGIVRDILAHAVSRFIQDDLDVDVQMGDSPSDPVTGMAEGEPVDGETDDATDTVDAVVREASDSPEKEPSA